MAGEALSPMLPPLTLLRILLSAGLALGPAIALGEPAGEAPPQAAGSPAPVFKAAERAVSTWRAEGAANLDLAPDAASRLLAGREAPSVGRCVKLNNYWCVKKAGWAGEIAADGEGHVAFSSAVEGAAVAALLLKRYYVDFGRKTALSIISHWAPAACGTIAARPSARGTLISVVLGTTLRARWLATHARGFVLPVGGKRAAAPRRSVVPDHVGRLAPAPTIALGFGEAERAIGPITLDALLTSTPGAPRSRSLIGLPTSAAAAGATAGCGGDGGRVAAYAAKAAMGIGAGPDGDLGLFDAAGAPTERLATMMGNMARVEIGPLSASKALIQAGIAEAFRPGRNPS